MIVAGSMSHMMSHAAADTLCLFAVEKVLFTNIATHSRVRIMRDSDLNDMSACLRRAPAESCSSLMLRKLRWKRHVPEGLAVLPFVFSMLLQIAETCW